MARVPNFLDIIEDYRCINLSARAARQLKPATDLATNNQQRSLAYVLDPFPELYCQRVTPASPQPMTTVSQPVLVVTFVPGTSPADRTDSGAVMGGKNKGTSSHWLSFSPMLSAKR